MQRQRVYKRHLVWPCRTAACCWRGISDIKCFAVLAELLRQHSACIWQNRAAVLSLAFLWLAPLAQMIPSKTQSFLTWQSAIIFYLFVQTTSLWLQDQGKSERFGKKSTDLYCHILSAHSEIMNEWECICWPMAWKKHLAQCQGSSVLASHGNHKSLWKPVLNPPLCMYCNKAIWELLIHIRASKSRLKHVNR